MTEGCDVLAELARAIALTGAPSGAIFYLTVSDCFATDLGLSRHTDPFTNAEMGEIFSNCSRAGEHYVANLMY